MAGPWEKYADTTPQPSTEEGPWSKYSAPVTQAEATPAAPQPVQTRSLKDEFMRQLGLTGRYMATIPAGVGGAIADAGVGAANLLGANLPKPSAEYQKFLSRLGLPSPETPMERGVAMASSIVGGAMDPAAVATVGALARPIATPIKPNGETVPMTGDSTQVARSNSYYKLHPGAKRIPAPKTVSSEAPVAAEPTSEGFQINAWDMAHLAGNLAAQRYGAALGNIAHMGAREWLHGRVPTVPSLFDPMTVTKMKMTIPEQADFNNYLFDPYMADQQRQYQK